MLKKPRTPSFSQPPAHLGELGVKYQLLLSAFITGIVMGECLQTVRGGPGPGFYLLVEHLVHTYSAEWVKVSRLELVATHGRR